MSLVYLFIIIIIFIFILSSLVGFIRFLLDIRKYSSYKAELDNLKQKYTDKLTALEKELKEDLDNENT